MDESEEFSVSVGFQDGFRVLVVRGELDEFTAPELDAVLNDGDGRPVILDLTPLVFTSSAGLHVLLRKRDTPTALVCPPGTTLRLFEIVQANRAVPVFDNLDHAVQSLTLSQSA